jgi:hypothetical protein
VVDLPETVVFEETVDCGDGLEGAAEEVGDGVREARGDVAVFVALCVDREASVASEETCARGFCVAATLTNGLLTGTPCARCSVVITFGPLNWTRGTTGRSAMTASKSALLMRYAKALSVSDPEDGCTAGDLPFVFSLVREDVECADGRALL